MQPSIQSTTDHPALCSLSLLSRCTPSVAVHPLSLLCCCTPSIFALLLYTLYLCSVAVCALSLLSRCTPSPYCLYILCLLTASSCLLTVSSCQLAVGTTPGSLVHLLGRLPFARSTLTDSAARNTLMSDSCSTDVRQLQH